MNRQAIVQNYFQRKHLLTIRNTSYITSLSQLFHWMIAADEIRNDQSVAVFSQQASGKAEIITKQSGVIAGLEEAIYLTKKYTSLEAHTSLIDGQPVCEETNVLTISGKYKELLAYERTFVNILGRMSGLATMTNKIVKTNNHSNIQISATRKTPWMLLDKKAVAVGGGLTHRLSLADWPMIKDNHLQAIQNILKTNAYNAVSEAIRRMINLDIPFFELEVDTMQQGEIAMQTFQKEKKDTTIMALLLDNFVPKEAKNFVTELKKLSIYNSILIEASGGISTNDLNRWEKTDVDIISLGSLTHSAKNFDLSMKFR